MYFIYLINTRNTEHVKIIVTYRNDSEQGKDDAVVYPGILLGGGVSTNSAEDRGQR